jgi:hypothetical protein
MEAPLVLQLAVLVLFGALEERGGAHFSGEEPTTVAEGLGLAVSPHRGGTAAGELLVVDERVRGGLGLELPECLEALGQILGAGEIAAEIEEASVGSEPFRVEFIGAAAETAEGPGRRGVDLGEGLVADPPAAIGEGRRPVFDGRHEGVFVDREVLVKALEVDPGAERMEVVAASRQGVEDAHPGDLAASGHGRSTEGGDVGILLRGVEEQGEVGIPRETGQVKGGEDLGVLDPLGRDLGGEAEGVAQLPEISVTDRRVEPQRGRVGAVAVVQLDAAMEGKGVLDDEIDVDGPRNDAGAQ